MIFRFYCSKLLALGEIKNMKILSWKSLKPDRFLSFLFPLVKSPLKPTNPLIFILFYQSFNILFNLNLKFRSFEHWNPVKLLHKSAFFTINYIYKTERGVGKAQRHVKKYRSWKMSLIQHTMQEHDRFEIKTL